jgi:hypothetical protein
VDVNARRPSLDAACRWPTLNASLNLEIFDAFLDLALVPESLMFLLRLCVSVIHRRGSTICQKVRLIVQFGEITDVNWSNRQP